MPKKSTLIKYLCVAFAIQAGAIATPAAAAILTVPVPYSTIQEAINDAVGGDEIVVSDGTYTGTGNYNIDTNGKAITVRSLLGPANCIIDCQGNGRAFIFQSGEDANTVLEGFTIINGYAEDLDWPQNPDDDPSGYGGAIYCTGSSPDINNCIITDNTADSGGGAIFCDAGSNAQIKDCNISYNYAGAGFYIYDVNFNDYNDMNQLGGGIYCRDSNPTMVNCIIGGLDALGWPAGNWAAGSGGGIACEDSDVVIMDCTISYNDCWLDDDLVSQHGGGIYCRNGSPDINGCVITDNDAAWSGGGIASIWDSNDSNDVLLISNCEILDNDCWASGGGIYTEGSFVPDPNDPNREPNMPIIPNCRIQNCLIANNWGYWSGGVSSDYGSFARIENCTIADNVVSYSSDPYSLVGGLECYYGDATVTNSIIWGNKGLQIAGVTGVDSVTYCDVQRLDVNGLVDPNAVWPGEGNINEDPLFASPIHRDYHLQTEELNGRYNPVTGAFDVNDPSTSPCINAGDPFSAFGLEPLPNGGRINMGAYGNTPQASMSDIIVPLVADIAGGMNVNMVDFVLLADNWLLEGAAIKNRKADLDNNGIVDEEDLFIFAKFWLW